MKGLELFASKSMTLQMGQIAIEANTLQMAQGSNRYFLEVR